MHVKPKGTNAKKEKEMKEQQKLDKKNEKEAKLKAKEKEAAKKSKVKKEDPFKGVKGGLYGINGGAKKKGFSKK